MITHEMQIVKDVCNRVAVMQNGVLIEEGSVLEMFFNPKEGLTKEFIATATGIDEALEKIYQQNIVKNLPKNAILAQLKYAGASTGESLMSHIYRQFEVTSNILYGNINILDHVPVGELVVVFEGTASNIQSAEKALHEAGVEVSILKRGV
ncbi:NIL domain-containing protein [Streptococcus phocae]|uniref:NIL domain-containing protein n=1 Tax=Streptococcus phocae TaxID=119224 RepID=UPI00373AE8A1